MQEFTLNLADKDGSESVQTGYEQTFSAENEEEALVLYLVWLMEGGFEQEEIECRILCDLAD